MIENRIYLYIFFFNYVNIKPKHLNWIYWVPLPNIVSCPSGEKNSCLFSLKTS